MDMDMDMGGMDMSGSDASAPLSPDGVDFSNATQAAEFLEDLLNDDELKLIGNNYAKYFWYGVVVVVAMTTLFNFLRWMTLQLRLREAARNRDAPAKPKSLFAKSFATITAMGREVTYLQFSPTTRFLWLKVPPAGTLLLLVVYLAFVLALEFTNNSVAGAQYWQALGIRAGWLAVAQMPLLILLINKNNVIGILTGVSYERLNVIHRWSARIMLLMAIFHFAFQSNAWQSFGLVELEWSTDDCPTTGIAAFALLLWMNLTTIAPFRYWSYEFFVIQHIITFFGFIVAIMYHLPSTALTSRVYILVPIGIYLLDRIVRTVRLAYNNLRASRATMVRLDGGVTKVRISNKAIKSWRAGAHALVSMPRFGFMQSHPATILSTPRSHGGDLVFLLKGYKGFTKRIMEGANTSTTALIQQPKDEGDTEQNVQVSNHLAFIDGPYGLHSDFAAFDSICLLAGSTGVTFTLALLQDVTDRATLSGRRLPVRRIDFVWCIKDTNWATWVNDEIAAAYDKLHGAGIDLEVSIYVTCADKFTNPGNDQKECGCECDKSKGPCCCVVVDEDEDGEEVDEIKTISEGKRQAYARAASSTSTVRGTVPGRRMPVLPCATFYSGRPNVRELLSRLLDRADGESSVAVCGPTGLSVEVRNTVVSLSDERAIHKGTGAQGCYVHVEVFS